MYDYVESVPIFETLSRESLGGNNVQLDYNE